MVGVERLKTGALRYRYSDEVLGNLVLLQDEILHLRCFSRDGMIGQSPLVRSAGAVGLAMAQADLASSQAERGFTPDLAFSTDREFGNADLANAAFARLKDQLSERVAKLGRGAAASILLEAGLKPTALPANNRDSNCTRVGLSALRTSAASTVCRRRVLGLGRQASYGSLTEESRAFGRTVSAHGRGGLKHNCSSRYCLPRAGEPMSSNMTCRGLERGDWLARLQAYQIGIQNEVLSPNEVRRCEGMAQPSGR